MNRLFFLLVLLAVNYPASASLRETEKQIETRYGPSVETSVPPGSALVYKTYKKNGFEIIVSFFDGKSVDERYAHENGGMLTDDEIQKLLDINSLGSKWALEKDRGKNAESVWKLESGLVVATNHVYEYLDVHEYLEVMPVDKPEQEASQPGGSSGSQQAASGTQQLTEEAVLSLFKANTSFPADELRQDSRFIIAELQQYHTDTADKLSVILSSPNISHVLSQLYIVELKRPDSNPLDPIGLARYGSYLYVNGINDGAIDAIRNSIRSSREYRDANSKKQAGPSTPANGALPTGIYEGNVIFTFANQTKLISHRTILVTGDQTAIGLICIEYYASEKNKKYVSKLIMKGAVKDGAFVSTEQECSQTDYGKWLPENMRIEFAADGATATLTSTYKNSSGYVFGTGALQRKP